jgi:hypothetical protein
VAKRERLLVQSALCYALTKSGSTHASAARWMGVDEATLRRWLRGTSSIRVEAVLASKRLSEPFAKQLLELCADGGTNG